MSDQFISAITDEAMSRICYAGGWDLKPFRFLVSQTDVFDGTSTQPAWDKKDLWDQGDDAIREQLKGEACQYLQKIVTQNMQDDYTSGNAWFNAKFSSITKTNETTLAHHLNIPGDIAIDTNSKSIKTIYFVYQDNAGQDFLYAIARCNVTLIFEKGITQSFFFNFTVTNAQTQDMTEFILNYSCAHEIEDHNTTFGDNIHSNLVARDGSRVINGILKYTGLEVEDFVDDDSLIPKKYVDKYIEDYVLPLMENTVCPAGKLDWWPGPVNTIPEGWALRNGQLLKIADNPKLYNMFGQKYKSECRSGTNYDTSTYFPLMNDSGLFIRASELDTSNNVANNSYLSGVAFASKQSSAAPNITGGLGAVNAAYWGAFYQNGPGRITLSTRNGSNWGSYGAIDASRSSSVYVNGVTEVRPNNRNYLPIIRLG